MFFDGKILKKERWWNLPQNETDAYISTQWSESEALSALDEVLTQSVTDRLISDVPLGALLSGGVDSSVVVALMQKVNRSPVRTFSIGFGEKGYNEAPWAKRIANHLGTNHTELYVSSKDALKVVPTLPEIYDEPFADSSAIPTFLVSRLTRSAVTVALSGDGGDEQFAGYVRYWMTESMARWMKPIPIGLRRSIKRLLDNIPANLLHHTYSSVRDRLPQQLQVENFQDKWGKLVSQLSETELAELYRLTVCIWSKKDVQHLTGGNIPDSTYEHIFNETDKLKPIVRLMRVDQHTYLPDAMLTKVDRASMAASLEIRVPLLDHRVVAFTARLPSHFKFRNGKGKYLLRKLLTRYIPREMVERPKMGFGVPIALWLRTELKELIADYLSPAHLHREGRLNPTFVNDVLQQHMRGASNHQHRLWTILMWEMWRERWL
ncbi:Asparagine synthetase (fragment) [Desulfosarcina cetonica]